MYAQNSSGAGAYAEGYAGIITPRASTLQVPTGTYKLKLANLFVENVAVTSAHSADVMLGTISLPNLTRSAEVYDQSSSGAGAYATGFAGHFLRTRPRWRFQAVPTSSSSPISFSNVSPLRPRGLQKFCWGRSVFPASLARPRSTIRVPPAPVRTPTGSPGECCRRQQRFRFLPVRTSSSWRIFSSNRFVSSPERPSSRSKAGSLQPAAAESQPWYRPPAAGARTPGSRATLACSFAAASTNAGFSDGRSRHTPTRGHSPATDHAAGSRRGTIAARAFKTAPPASGCVDPD